MPTADELFNRALPAFTKHIRNSFDDAAEEFRKKLNELIKEKGRLAQIEESKTPGMRVVIDHYGLRYSLYREHAAKIGEEFFSAFANIVKPHCEMISQSSKAILFKLLSSQYQSKTALERSTIQEYAASIGRSDQANGMILPMEGIYSSVHSKYHNRLDAQIERHNLEMARIRFAGRLEKWGTVSKGKVKKPKPKAKMRAIYNSLVSFHTSKRTEYEQKNGTPYGAAKYADETTTKEIWRLYRVKVSPRNVRDAMSRN